jgi:hypothetical protein
MLFKKSTLGLMTITTLTCSGLSLATQVPVFAQSDYSSEDYQQESDYNQDWADYEQERSDYNSDSGYDDWAEYYGESADSYQDKSDTYEDYATDEQYYEDSYSEDSGY